jgi:hypothetical protein
LAERDCSFKATKERGEKREKKKKKREKERGERESLKNSFNDYGDCHLSHYFMLEKERDEKGLLGGREN